MKEFTVKFDSVAQIGEFASLVNRQPFSVQLQYDNNVLDASSIMNLCYMGLHKPLIVLLREDAPAGEFCEAMQPYLVPDEK